MAEVKVGENESIESALRRFKKKIQKAGILSEVKKRERYEKPSVKRKHKSEAARKRIECLDDILVRLKQSSFDYNVALMSPPWDQDENGVPTLVKAEIKLAEDRKDLLSFIQLIDQYMY